MARAKTTDAERPHEPAAEPEQIAICTRDEHCKATVDMHEPDCPVEKQLRKDFGY